MARYLDPNILAHLEWLGFVRPTGLVVSAPALVRAGAILLRNDSEGQRLLALCLAEPHGDQPPAIADFHQFARTVLDWSFTPNGYAGVNVSAIPPALQVSLPEYGETLTPDLAVRELDPAPNATPWQLLVTLLPAGQEFERVTRGHGRLEASAHGRMERLLRQSGVSAGLLFNGVALRLISAPRGESSGWLDFRVADMLQTAGRPIIAALRLLLNQQRLLALPREQRLAALLSTSRAFQNEVSERLAEQVLHALYALLRGFQAANEETHGTLLYGPLRDNPDDVYRAQLTVILRLIFLLYAEERDMLPTHELWEQGYALSGLYERLREDAALYPDTMQQRYGAWAQLLVLFRMIYDGVEAGDLHLPRRHGVLFDPNRFPFLEGRAAGSLRQAHQHIVPPRVPDGTVYQALDQLLLLDGERISYRALDVEQIGSVYETMMGFQIETATGRALAIRAAKKGGAPTTISLDALLELPPAKRAPWLQEQADRKPADGVRKALQAATSIDDLHAALRPLLDTAATPDIVAPGAMVLQPSPERRRSGSHYTPRALTEPIVRTTLEPILARLRGADGLPPRPAQILDLKICDPAMGSGAFLVEACRQLGDALIEAWQAHGEKPPIPPDEDEVIYARRLVAQRCLYGVDKNPTAVDLAKVSLWLVTLAKEHALTFVDHALRHGDSLVGLSRRQIEAFHWQGDAPRFQEGFEAMQVRAHVARAAVLRGEIRHAGEGTSDAALNTLWREAQDELAQVRLYGDLVVAAFFEGGKDKERETKRREYADAVLNRSAAQQAPRLEEWRDADLPLVPFHWEIEFPEVFQRENPGFDAVVGNPPFLGGTMISTAFGSPYRDFISHVTPNAGGRCDLVAYFFRQAYSLCRNISSYGLIGTKTIAQGDTRRGGLSSILANGGTIFHGMTSMKWPGSAAVTVSVVHVSKGLKHDTAMLNGHACRNINPFLLQSATNDEPQSIGAEIDYFLGSKLYGQGFLFDDSDEGATPLSVMKSILEKSPEASHLVRPYVGGKEINSVSSSSRWVIDFGEMSESEAREYKALWTIVADRLPATRAKAPQQVQATPFWWFFNRRTYQYASARSLNRVLVRSAVSEHHVFRWFSPNVVFSHNVFILIDSSSASMSLLHSRVHEEWVNLTSSSLEDRQGYRPSDCLDTFPFPLDWRNQSDSHLFSVGTEYSDFRDTLMSQSVEGLTDVYNRFHDPYEHDGEIAELRELHAAMDRAVLDAYGWPDIPTACEFLLDYEIDEAEWGSKKKPYRYRWPDAVRDEVLARLLELNAQRARDEQLAGATKAKGGGKKKGKQGGMENMFE